MAQRPRDPVAACPLFAIHSCRIEQPLGIDEGESRAVAIAFDLAVEAGVPPGVTRRTNLLDPKPDRILIAIGAHLDHALGLTRGLALAPQRVARSAEIPGI